MFWCKTFKIKDELLVTICDEKLLNKTISKEPKVKVHKLFYGGKLVDEDEAVKLMRKSSIGNLMGEEIIKIAARENFITKKNVILIGDVPHAQYINFKKG